MYLEHCALLPDYPRTDPNGYTYCVNIENQPAPSYPEVSTFQWKEFLNLFCTAYEGPSNVFTRYSKSVPNMFRFNMPIAEHTQQNQQSVHSSIMFEPQDTNTNALVLSVVNILLKNWQH